MSSLRLPLFLAGALRVPKVLALVAGGPVAAEPARLAVHRGEAAGVTGATLEGRLASPGPSARARVDFYQAALGLAPTPADVETGRGRRPALVYRASPAESRPPDTPVECDPVTAMAAAAEVMDYYGRLGPAEVAARWPLILQRAISARNAAQSPTPVALRRGLGAGDIELLAHRRPYSDFFTVVEDDLRFRRFDGAWSPPVTRAGFVAGDAVTVLPYDPHRDTVLVIEQFRFGPHARGDRHPWTLEPIAGRIDPGEAPEATALREAVEEAGVTLERLELAARYYPSTGALAEYVWSYVGLADLDGAHGRIGGVHGEAEDILAHVIAFDALMGLVASGEAECSPLLISAYWLAANRARLRA